MHRLHVGADAVAVAADSVNQLVAGSRRFQKLRRLGTVLLRIQLEINIMKQTGDSPEVLVITIAKFLRIPPHGALDGQCVKDVKRLLVILS